MHLVEASHDPSVSERAVIPGKHMQGPACSKLCIAGLPIILPFVGSYFCPSLESLETDDTILRSDFKRKKQSFGSWMAAAYARAALVMWGKAAGWLLELISGVQFAVPFETQLPMRVAAKIHRRIYRC